MQERPHVAKERRRVTRDRMPILVDQVSRHRDGGRDAKVLALFFKVFKF